MRRKSSTFCWGVLLLAVLLSLAKSSRTLAADPMDASPDGQKAGEAKTTGEFKAAGAVVTPGGDDIYLVERSPLVEKGHEPIALAISHDGRMLASLGKQGDLKLWKLPGGELAKSKQLSDDTGANPSLTWSPNDRTLAVCDGLALKLVDAGSLDVRKTIDTAPSGVQFLPDARRFVARQFDRFELWDADTAERLREFGQATGSIRTPTLSPDGALLAGALEAGSIVLFNPATGEKLATLSGHQRPVKCMAFTPNGRLLVSTDEGSETRVWNIAKKELIRTIDDLAFDIACLDSRRIILASMSLRIYDLATGEELTSYPYLDYSAHDLAVTPDGKLIVVVNGEQIRLIEVRRSRESTALKLLVNENYSEFVSAALDQNRHRLATGRTDGVVQIWDLAKRGIVQTFPMPEGEDADDLCFSPGGESLLSVGSGKARLWNLRNDPPSDTLLAADAKLEIHAGIFLADGRIALGGAPSEGDDNLLLLRLKGDEEIERRPLHAHLGPVLSLASDPSGRRLISGSNDETARVWDLKSGEELLALAAHPEQVTAVAISADGKTMATAGGTDLLKEIKLWNDRGELLHTIPRPDEEESSLAFSPDGKHLLAGCIDGRLRTWEVASGALLAEEHAHRWGNAPRIQAREGEFVTFGFDPVAKLWEFARIAPGDSANAIASEAETKSPDANSPDLRTLTLAAPQRRIELGTNVSSLAFSPDGQWLAACGGMPMNDPNAEENRNPPRLRLWNRTTGALRWEASPIGPAAPAIVFAPDGKTIYTSSGSREEIGWIEGWDAATGKQVHRFSGRDRMIESLAITPDGKTLFAAGGSEETAAVHQWKLEGIQATSLPTRQLAKDDKRGFSSLAISPDGKRLAAALLTRRIEIFDIASGERVQTIDDSWALSMAYTADNKQLITCSNISGSAVTVWNIDSGEVAARHHGIPSKAGVDASYQTLSLSADGRWIALADAGSLVILDAATFTLKRIALLPGLGRIQCVAFSPKEPLLAVGYEDGAMLLWEMDSLLDLPAAEKLDELFRAGGRFQMHDGDQFTLQFYVAGPVSAEFFRHTAGLRQLNRIEISNSPHDPRHSNARPQPVAFESMLKGLRDLPSLNSIKLDQVPEPSEAAFAHLATLPALKGLEIRFCSWFTDQSIPWVAKLPKLQRLALDGTRITAASIEPIAKLPNLRELDIEVIGYKDGDLEPLVGLPKLNTLSLGGYGNKETTFAELRRLKHVKRLTIRLGGFGDKQLADVGRLQQLEALSLEHQGRITDAGFAALAKLENLQTLDLRFTSITDEGLDHLAGLKQLVELNLHAAEGVTDEGVDALKKKLPALRIVR